MIASRARALAIVGGFDAVWLVAACDAARVGNGGLSILASLSYLAALGAAGYLRRTAVLGIIAAGIAGACIETIFVMSGLVSYAPVSASVGALPLWVVGIWLAFAASLIALWTEDVIPLVAVIGFSLGAPLAYVAGDHIGALRLAHLSVERWGAVSLAYALPIVLLRHLARRTPPENRATATSQGASPL